MDEKTARKWSRDALETMHQLKHETKPIAVLAKRHAKRIVALVDAMVSANIPDRKNIST